MQKEWKKTAPNNNSDNNSGSNDIEHEEIWLEYMNIRQTKRVKERKKNALKKKNNEIISACIQSYK